MVLNYPKTVIFPQQPTDLTQTAKTNFNFYSSQKSFPVIHFVIVGVATGQCRNVMHKKA